MGDFGYSDPKSVSDIFKYTSGSVLYVDSTGLIQQDNAGLFYNPTTDTLTVAGNLEFKSGTSFKGIFDHANSAERTYTLPNATGTLAELELAQIWTAIQTFQQTATMTGGFKTTNLFVREYDANTIAIRNLADNAFKNLYVDVVTMETALYTNLIRTKGGVDVLTLTQGTGAVDAQSRIWSNFVATSPTFSGTIASATIRITTAAASTDGVSTKVTGDADQRFIVRTDGLLGWGDGTNPVDTNLYRSAANTLKTDDAFSVTGLLTALGDLSIGANKIKTTDYQISQQTSLGVASIIHEQQGENSIWEALKTTAVGGVTVRRWLRGDNTNYSGFEIKHDESNAAIELASFKGGTGTLLPIKIYMGGNLIETISTSNTRDFNSRAVSNFVAGSDVSLATFRLTKLSTIHFDSTNIDIDSNIQGSRSSNLSLASSADGATARNIVLRTPTVITAGTGTPVDRLILATGAAGAGGIFSYEAIIFDGNSSAALTAARTAIGADGVGGNLLLNTPTANGIRLQNNAVTKLSVLSTNLEFADAYNIAFNATTGTKIGTATTQKLAFFNSAPIVQQAAIVNADGTLADITTKFNTLLGYLRATAGFGLIAG